MPSGGGIFSILSRTRVVGSTTERTTHHTSEVGRQMSRRITRRAALFGIAVSTVAATFIALGSVAVAAPGGGSGSWPRSDQAPEQEVHGLIGVVVDEHGQTLVVRTRRGPVDVHWTDATECVVSGDSADCDRIAVGMMLAARGQYAGGSDQFHAEVIGARTPLRDLDRVSGVIRAEDGMTLSVESRDGSIHPVAWTPETTCRTRHTRFDCERLELGDRIVAIGTEQAGTLMARLIGVRHGGGWLEEPQDR